MVWYGLVDTWLILSSPTTRPDDLTMVTLISSGTVMVMHMEKDGE